MLRTSATKATYLISFFPFAQGSDGYNVGGAGLTIAAPNPHSRYMADQVSSTVVIH